MLVVSVMSVMLAKRLENLEQDGLHTLAGVLMSVMVANRGQKKLQHFEQDGFHISAGSDEGW